MARDRSPRKSKPPAPSRSAGKNKGKQDKGPPRPSWSNFDDDFAPNPAFDRQVEALIEAREAAGKGKDARPAPPAAPRPAYVPPGFAWESLSPDLQTALVEIVSPSYEALVRQVADPLEKAAGITLVNLLWMEIVEAAHLGEGCFDSELLRSLSDHGAAVTRQLQVSEAKVKATYVLVRLKECRQAWGRLDAALDPPARACLPVPPPILSQ